MYKESENKYTRLGQLAKELNVSTTTIVAVLRKRGYEIEDNRNCKLQSEMISILRDHFAYEKRIKEESKELDSPLFILEKQARPSALDFSVNHQKETVEGPSSVKVFDALKTELKISEIFLGTFTYTWQYLKVQYTADCTEAIRFDPFDKAICGLLLIEDVMDFFDIGTVLGFNVVDDPTHNKYKDVAECEILHEKLQSLVDYQMITCGDSAFSRCRLTNVGREYAQKGWKFKFAESKEFTMFFDETGGQHGEAKTVFEDAVGTLRYDNESDLDIENEDFVKECALSQCPDIYNPEIGTSFKNLRAEKVEAYEMNLTVAVIYDFQEDSFSFRICSKHNSAFFDKQLKENSGIRSQCLRKFLMNCKITQNKKSEEQQEYEYQTSRVQSEYDYAFVESGNIERALAIKKEFDKQPFKYMPIPAFWNYIDNYFPDEHIKLFIKTPRIKGDEEDRLIKYCESHPKNEVFLICNAQDQAHACFEITEPPTSSALPNFFVLESCNRDIDGFECVATNGVKVFPSTFNLYVEEFDVNCTFSTLQQGAVSQSDADDMIKERCYPYALLFLPMLLDQLDDQLDQEYPATREGVQKLMDVDANIQNFLPWRKELGLQKKVFSLREKKTNLLAKLKKDHSQKLIARLDSIEEKIIDVQDVKLLDVTATEIKNIREECLSDYKEVLSKISELEKMLQESRDRIQGTTYVIDTNTLIDYPDILSKIEPQNTILLSAKVIEELNVKKQTIPAAQKALKNIKPKLMERKNVRVVTADTNNLPVEFSRKDADNMILSIAISAKRKNPCLLTSDVGLQDKALACGIPISEPKKLMEGIKSKATARSDNETRTESSKITDKQLIQSDLKLVKMTKPRDFFCNRCMAEKNAKVYAIVDNNAQCKICNGCYGFILSRRKNNKI